MEIITGSRLHFGLLHVPGSHNPTVIETGACSRSFGGVGLMIEEPALRLEALPAASWGAEGWASDAVLAFAQACRDAVGVDCCPPLQFRCNAAPARHAGFGSGTQLGLAVASLVARFSNRSSCPVSELADWVGRGKRSWVGIHGFQQGGFLVEAGKRGPREASTLLVRHPFPDDWRILIIRQTDQQAIHGAEEASLFSEMHRDEHAHQLAQELSRLLLLEMLPALLERDLQGFGESLSAYNRKAGERFAKVQGGLFASSRVEALIGFLKREGAAGAGQSSWGPWTFAICGDEPAARHLADRVTANWPGAELVITRARNTGAAILG